MKKMWPAALLPHRLRYSAFLIVFISLFATNHAFAQTKGVSFSPASGAPGTVMTIKGRGLDVITGVYIGSGLSSFILSKNDTTITLMVSPVSTSGRVILNIAQKTNFIVPGNFTLTTTASPKMQIGPKLADNTQYPRGGGVKTNLLEQGYSVAVSADGNTAMAGARIGAVDNAAYGAVIFYERINGVWRQADTAKLALGQNAAIGYKCAISANGQVALATAVNNGNYLAEFNARTYAFNKVNGKWSAPVDIGNGGHSVSMAADGKLAVISNLIYKVNPAESNGNQPALPGHFENGIFLAARNVNGTWAKLTQLASPADVGDRQAGVGHDVAMSAEGKYVVAVVKRLAGNSAIYGWRPDKSTGVWGYHRSIGVPARSVAISANGSFVLASDTSAGATLLSASGGFSVMQKFPETGKGAISPDGTTIVFAGQSGPIVYIREDDKGVFQGYVKQATPFNTPAGQSIAMCSNGVVLMGSPLDSTTVANQTITHGPAFARGRQSLGGVYAFTAYAPVVTPSAYATGLKFTETTGRYTRASWVNGNGSRRAVFVKVGKNGAPLPVDSTIYTASVEFRSPGSRLGTSEWYCVYNGTESSAYIFRLSAGTTYRVAVVEYNGENGGEKYHTATIAPAEVTTTLDGVAPAKTLAFSNTTGTTTTVSWANGGGVGRAVFISKAANGAPVPTNVYYSANTKFRSGNQIASSGWYCIYNGTGSTVNVTGLTSGQTYRVAVVEYRGTLAAPLYVTEDLTPANVTTLVTSPTGYATNPAFSNTMPTATTLSWQSGNGTARAVFLKMGGSGAFNVIQGQTYTGNSSYGAGSPVGTNGWYCVYNGTGSNVNITGLTASTAYRAVVIEYNGTAGSEAYNLSRFETANVTTAAAPSLSLTTAQKRMLVEQDAVIDDTVTGVNVHQALSPNGDGVNDVFIIDGIGIYPNNTVQIMNSNGDVIYSAAGYDNYSKAFNGRSANGTLQKAGTYFYSLEYKKGADVVHKTGYFIIKM